LISSEYRSSTGASSQNMHGQDEKPCPRFLIVSLALPGELDFFMESYYC
jgi:hypothetical protein